ncbi:hypothetical protein ACNHKD_07060 [Methylocystis sp. JAN1]|uniref:hypothetical protein n=1 Tax=Methylocystis sp. JAN1 TaxID=3397211 RepID=UPI003FA28F48
MVSEMTTYDGLCNEVVQHLGGEASLREIGARVAADDHSHVSLRLNHPNPRGVRSVVITARGNGLFDMDCFGPMRLDAFHAERVGHAEQIAPDSLASVLGMMTGVESLPHHHY